MQILVLGAGLQGVACSWDLLARSDAMVTVADVCRKPVPQLLEPFADRVTMVELDIRDEPRVRALMANHQGVLSALPYYFNFPAARMAVETGVHFADLGGNTEIVRRQETLDAEAREKNVTVLPDCGLAPGMVNIIAADGISRLDTIEAVRLYVGGLPQHPEPPLNYQIVYSLEGALDYYTTESWIVRDGEPTTVDALSELEMVGFPDPVGNLEAFHTAGGLSTMPWEYEGRVETMEYKTLRYPGHADIMRAIRDLGLLGLDPVQTGDASVRPRDVFVSVVDPKLRRPEGEDFVALQVTVTGKRDGASRKITYRVLDWYDSTNGVSAMMRATAFSLSITGQLQVGGKIDEPGVWPAYKATPAAAYFDELNKRDIVIDVQETA